jgi:hypothetical protein
MFSPDPLDQIREQSLVARGAIAETQDIIANCIAALERNARVLCATLQHDGCADPPFPLPP